MELSELALWTMRPRLMSVPGVANVAIWGQRDKQYQVLVDPERLRAAGVTLDAVMRAAGDAAVLSAGGFIDTPNQRLAVRQLVVHHLGRRPGAHRGRVPQRRAHPAGRCGARWSSAIRRPIGDAVINDGPGLLLIVEKQPWGNTLDVTREVERALADLKPGLAGVEMDSTIFRPATFIEMSLDNLSQAMWLGCVLVVVILILFLCDWRTAFISLTAIPLSLLVAVLVVRWRGRDHQHHGAGRPGHRPGRSGGRRHHRRGEHPAPAAAEPRSSPSRCPPFAGGAQGLARSPQRRRLCQPHRGAGVPAGVLPRRPGRHVLPAAGHDLRPGHAGVAAGRAHRHARALR